MKWVEEGTDPQVALVWRKQMGEEFARVVPAPKVWRTQGGRAELVALAGREPLGPHREAGEDLRWHISVRGPGRVPTWEEMVTAAHQIRPGVVFCVPMPPRSWWINVHEDVLHLWEIRDHNLENQWRIERRGQGDRPT